MSPYDSNTTDESDAESLSSSSSETERRSRPRTRISKKKRKRERRSSSSRSVARKRHRLRTPSSIDEDIFFKKFTKFIDRKGSGTFEGAQNVIPDFDPDANTQSAAEWLRKVNQTAVIYGWSHKQIVYYAIPKLAGYAKKWYQSLSSVNLNWRQWQRRIMKTFPDDRNYADRLYEMLERKSKRDECLEEYYHDKARLVKMCGIAGRDAVDCIINGIFDHSVRLNAQGSNFKQPIQLLKYLRRITKKTNNIIRKPIQTSRPSGIEIKTDSSNRTGATSASTSGLGTPRNRVRASIRCYNCSELGHTANVCSKPIKKCDKCSRLGHEAYQCQTSVNKPKQMAIEDKKPETPRSDIKRVQQIVNDKQNGKYFKTIKLNGTVRSAYIDFGSQCTLVKDSIAKETGVIYEKTGLPVLKGFAFGSVVPLGRVVVSIEVDAVNADVDAYVVDDQFINTDVFIGQSLTELPSVTVYKTSSQLVLYCDDSKIQRVNVLSATDTTLEGLTNIAVTTESNYTGLLFVPGNLCMKNNGEFSTLQGVYELKDGKGHILVLNLTDKHLTFPKNKIVSRAIKLPDAEKFKREYSEVTVKSISSENTIVVNNDELPSITIEMLNVGPKVSNEQKEMLLLLLNKYRGTFALNLHELGLTNITEMTIRLSDDTPVTYKPYRLPYSERAVVRELVGELMANGIVTESQSAYASPIVLVRKKNKEYRLCVDYRALNRKTIKDSYPMPVIDDQLDRLSGKTLFTSLDLASGYHQIPVSACSRHVTAFVTPDGHYEYTRMPFGLVNAPAVFQNMINKALGNRRFELAVPYLDDLLSAASTFDEAYQKLEEILMLLSKAGLTLNLKKCFFFQSDIDYLGYEISESGLKPGNKKTQAVSEFPTPSNVHQVRQFVGLASFFRRFVYNFATIARPLTMLTKADVAWQWGPEQEAAFHEIKLKLTSRPILALYDPKLETEVHCDASKVGVGGVLFQRQSEKAPLRPVAYFSRQTTREEEFWHSYELETMAVVLSLQKFRVYLIGLQFKVVTDCNALRTTLTKRDLLPKVARWWLMLQEFNFSIEYRPGHNMQHVDALSRNPVQPASDRDELELLQITTNDWLHTVQMTDPHLKQIRAILNTSTDDIKDITENYLVRDDKLYRRVGQKLKWVVPRGARWRICQLSHDEAGHFSVEKTLEKISSDYWFPKMNRFVKKYVASCMNCAYNKELAGKKTGYLHPIPKAPSIFHTVHMDHLGPFIKSKRGNTYILGVIDGFSKFIFIRPVKNTKSKTTIKVLEEIFATFGYPKIIISDQGTSFTSNEFKNFAKSIGVKHVYNAVSTPRANGQIERYNRTILNSLAAMNHGLDEKDWDTNLGKLQWSLNNVINKGIGKSPAEVVFGQRTTGQSENIYKEALPETTQATEEQRDEIRKEVEEKIENNQRKMKETFDKNRAPTKLFKEGDLVMIPNHNPEKGKSKKLAPRFRGPFKITSVLDKDRYEISSIAGHAGRKYKNIYPADQLKPWITFQGSPTRTDESNESSDDSEAEKAD